MSVPRLFGRFWSLGDEDIVVSIHDTILGRDEQGRYWIKHHGLESPGQLIGSDTYATVNVIHQLKRVARQGLQTEIAHIVVNPLTALLLLTERALELLKLQQSQEHDDGSIVVSGAIFATVRYTLYIVPVLDKRQEGVYDAAGNKLS